MRATNIVLKEVTMKRHHRSLFAVGAAILSLVGLHSLALPNSARAMDGDVRAGILPDADQVAIGGGVLTSMGNTGRWYFNPNVEVAMGNHRDVVHMSGDFHYDLNEGSGPSFWVGGGPAVLFVNREEGADDTDLGVNVLTGVGAKSGQVRPFAQLRGTVADESQVTIAGGIRF